MEGKIILIGTFFLLLSCNLSNRNNSEIVEKIESNEKSINKYIPTIYINNNAVQTELIHIDSVILLASYENEYDSIFNFSENCHEEMCHGKSLFKYRLSSKGHILLKYEPISGINTLMKSDGEVVDTFQIYANNPEFGVETIPLESDLGILKIDRLRGVLRFPLRKDKSSKMWEVKWNEDYHMHSYALANSELYVFKGDYINNLASLDRFSLEDGRLINRDSFNYSIYETKQIHHEDLILKYDNAELVLYDLVDKNKYTTEIKKMPTSVYASRYEGGLYAFYVNGTDIGITLFKDNQRLSTNVSIDSNYTISKITAINQEVYIYYLLVNTPGVLTNNTKLLSQGILVYNLSNSKIRNIKIPPNTGFINIFRNDDQVMVSFEGKIFKLISSVYN